MHSISYRHFKRGEFKLKDAEHMLNKLFKKRRGATPPGKKVLDKIFTEETGSVLWHWTLILPDDLTLQK